MRGFKLADIKLKDMYADDLLQYRKNNEIHVDVKSGKFFYRAKKVTKNSPVTKRIAKKTKRFFSNWFLLKILIMSLVLNGALVNYINTPEAQAQSVNNVMDVDDFIIRLDPVRFTDAELKIFYDKHKIPETTEEIIKDIFKGDAEWAFKCLMSENYHKNPMAINHNKNGTIDIGVFQINTVHCGKVSEAKGSDACVRKLQDVRTNVMVAKRILDTQGKSAWYGRSCN